MEVIFSKIYTIKSNFEKQNIVLFMSFLCTIFHGNMRYSLYLVKTRVKRLIFLKSSIRPIISKRDVHWNTGKWGLHSNVCDAYDWLYSFPFFSIFHDIPGVFGTH